MKSPAFRTVSILLLAAVVLLAALCVSSPAMAEDWLPDLTSFVETPIDQLAGPMPSYQYYESDLCYSDPTIRVEITTDRYCDTPMYIANVSLADASQMRTMLAGSYISKRTTLATTLAKRGNAVLAINGDYYCYDNAGLVVRQGVEYRCNGDGRYDVLMIDEAGDFHIVLNADKETLNSAYQALGGAYTKGGHVMQGLTFGPAYIVDGKPAHDVYTRPDNRTGHTAQRMAIAQIGRLEYRIYCCEGPDNTNSRGLTLPEMAEYIARDTDVLQAYNLDGGSSACMIFRDEKINARSTAKNRSIPDILYFITGYVGE